jgi:hypothetical protein
LGRHCRFIWYAVALIPVQIAVTSQFGLSSAEVSSWIFHRLV